MLSVRNIFAFIHKLFYIVLFIILNYFIGNECLAQNVTITGNDTSYSNEELIFYTYTDYISQNEKELCRFKVQPNGNFSCSFNINETIQAYIYLNVFKGLIYFEPNRNYEIVLPPKTLKTVEEEYNPYFKEYEIYLGISNSDENELNYLIKKFDNQYDIHLKKIFYNVKGLGEKSKIDSIIIKINKDFLGVSNKYFTDYKNYKFAYLKYLEYQQNIKIITKRFFLNRPILYNNSAYMYLFNQVFENYLSLYSKTKEGGNIINDIILSKSVSKLKKTLGRNITLSNDTLKELVILKGLHDAFYSGNIEELVCFPKPQLLQTLDSLKILTKVPIHIDIAKNIRKKATNLMVGTDAPFFQLYNLSNHLKKNTDFNGKYLYLHFAATWSYPCVNEFEIINNFYSKYKNDVEVVTIFADKDISVINSFLSEHDYKWTFLYCKENSEVLKTYNVKTYPTYFLIDPNGTFVLSPSPGITEHFEEIFSRILKNN